MWKLVKQFALDPSLCFLDQNSPAVLPDVTEYNQQVEASITWLRSQKETFLIRDKQSCVLVEDGVFYGMGTIDADISITELNTLKSHLTHYPENEVIRSMIRNYTERYPAKVVRMG